MRDVGEVTVEPKLFKFKGTITDGDYKDENFSAVCNGTREWTVTANGKKLLCRKIVWIAEAGEPAEIIVSGYVTDGEGNIVVG